MSTNETLSDIASRTDRRIPDPFTTDTSTASTPKQPSSTDTPENTRINTNDIVASRTTQNNATVTPSNITTVPHSMNSIQRTQHDIVAGSTTQNNATAPPSTNPTISLPSPRQRRRQRRRRHIAPTTVPIITPPRPVLREAHEDNMNRLIQKIGGLDLTTDLEKEHLTPYGDNLQLDPAWPNPGDRDYIRIFLTNANGISYRNQYLEWEMNLGFMHDMQIDIFGITEPNLDFSQPQVTFDMLEKSRRIDRFLDLASRYSTKSPVRKTPFKMGGTITGVGGGWSGRKAASGTDKIRRWSWVSLHGQGGKKFTTITFYRPCISSSTGECTIHLQQMHDLLTAGHDNPNPRSQLLHDLRDFIQQLHDDNHTVLLMGDMNSAVQHDAEIIEFLASCSLQNVITTRHGPAPLPSSYDRGPNCVDIMAISDSIPASKLLRSGMLPFYFNFATDHRGFFCDISTDWLFSKVQPDIAKSTMKRFTTSRVPRCAKYLDTLDKHFTQSEMYRETNLLSNKFIQLQHDPQSYDRHELIARCKILFNKTTEYMKQAERSCGTIPNPTAFPFSPALRAAGEDIYAKKRAIRILSLRQSTDHTLLDQAQAELVTAYAHLRATQAHSTELRQEFLDQLKEKRAAEWNLPACEALFIIEESERSRRLHAKHKSFMKPSTGGNLRTLLVPAPITGYPNNIRDPRTYYTVEDPAHIHELLLRRNFTQLQRSNNSIFASGPFADYLGHHGENKTAYDELLAGLDDPTRFDDAYPAFAGELAPFLESLRSQVQQNDATFDWQYGAQEFIDTFKKTRESTACGPSSLHMSHFCAATENREIAGVHAFFIWAAFQHGFSYDRWEISWHCMLKKMDKPYIDKLRIIQLFEGDFNAGLKFFLGKLLMQHITRTEYTDPETYGSRIGKSATEAIITLQTLFAHCTIWNKAAAMVFNDAAGCYDRVPLALADLAAVGAGCSPSIMTCHTQVQRNMQHYIRTAAGVSQGYFKFDILYLITTLASGVTIFQGILGGIGQGGGGGPILWLLISIILIKALRKLCHGATMTHVLGWFDLLLWIVSYVDDNTLLQTYALGTPHHVIFSDMKKMMMHWHRLLQITGGDLCLEKCKVSILAWKFNNCWGLPTVCSTNDCPGNITMVSALDPFHQHETIDRIEPWTGERILGIRLAITGTMIEEFTYRQQQLQEMADLLQKAPFRPHDAWMVYESRYRAAIRFPLPATSFTTDQCNSLQKPFILHLLAKLGLNRHTPRAIIYGPKSLGGLQLMDLRCEQPTMHYRATLGHLRRQDKAGQGLLINLSDLQASIGSATPVFQLDPTIYNYSAENTRLQYLWTSLNEHNCTLKGWYDWAPKPVGPKDRNIMDTAVNDSYFGRRLNYRLKIINQCRLYLGAIFLSDLEHNGTIDKRILQGDRLATNPQVQRIPIEKPSAASWHEWKAFISRNFLIQGYRLQYPIDRIYTIGPILRPRTERDLITALYTTHLGASISSIIAALPTSLHSLLGTVAIPSDEGLALAHAIEDGTAVGASDGSVINTFDELYGGSAATIQQPHSDTDAFSCYSPSPHSSQLCSLTTELYGFITATILIHVINGATMRDYYLTRRGWTNTELGMVDWEAISLMLNATPHTKRMKILQLQHGWQNTGYQKLQFLEATDETITEDMKTDNDVYCPFDCGEHEGRLHYMHCTQDTMQKKRLQLRRALLDRMRRRHTDPLLLGILNYVLTCLDTASPIDFQPEWTTTPSAPMLSKLFDHQSALGWTTILQGFFVHEWSRIQRHYMRHHPQPQRPSTSTPYKRPTIEGWKKTFATELISYTIDCWQHRNDKLHGALDILHDAQHRKLLHKRVRKLYKESRILTRPDDKRYFRMPCRLRVKQRHVTLETWADTVGLIIIRHRERTARETLDTWIMQRPGTTHSP